MTLSPETERAVAEFETAEREMREAHALAASFLERRAQEGDPTAVELFAIVRAAERRVQVTRLDTALLLE